ncbi:MAG: GNAT family N-acetyltransferase [Xanthomonadales bacterium]|nr:GNAT family N-acetyltransferase [Xanthomonadales bacterium]
MIIRKANAEDINAISSLLIQLSEKFITSSFTDEGKGNLLRSMNPEAIRGYFDQGYRYHVADRDGEILGVVGMKNDTHLYHLFVAEAEQGAGLARRLWETAKSDCLSRSSPEYFTVNSSLNAEKVYKSWGFVPVAGVRETGGVKDIPMKLETGC